MKNALIFTIAIFVSGHLFAAKHDKKDNSNPIAQAHANTNGLDNSNINSALKGDGEESENTELKLKVKAEKEKADKLAKEKNELEAKVKAEKNRADKAITDKEMAEKSARDAHNKYKELEKQKASPPPTKQPVKPVYQVQTIYSYLTLTNYVNVTRTTTNTVVATVPSEPTDSYADSMGLRAAQGKFFNLNSLQNDYHVGGIPRKAISNGVDGFVSLGETSTEVVRFNLDTGAVLQRYQVPLQPVGLAYTGGNHIFVASQRANMVSKLNTVSGAIEGMVSVPNSPISITFNGEHLFVGQNESSIVSKINPNTMTVVANYQVGYRPVDITSDSNNVYTVNYGDNTISVITKNGQPVRTITTNGVQPYGICLDVNGKLWVSFFNNGGPGMLNCYSNGQLYKTFPNLGQGLSGITTDGQAIFVTAQVSSELFRVDEMGNIESVKTGRAPYSCLWDGVNVWVVNQLDGSISKR